MLEYEEINELEQAILEELPNKLRGILTKLNRTGQLEEALKLWDLDFLLEKESGYSVYKSGKILVIGQSDVAKDVLLSIAGKAGIDKRRVELHLEYNDAKSFDFRTIQWNPSYSVILVGPMPHSGKSRGDASSVISAIESTVGYPPVVHLGTKALKITKSDFRAKIEELIDNGVIVA